MAILNKSSRLKKELSLVNVYAIATGTTLSAGFFLLPGLAVAEAGPALPLAYVIAAIPLIPAMFSIVELSTAMPRAGGAYYFLDRSLGPLAGTIGGLGTWLALSLKTAFALIGMGAYLQLFAPNLPLLPVAIGLALFFGGVNLVGAKGAGTLQVVLVAGLLGLLTWFMGGITRADPANFKGFFSVGVDSLISTAGLVYISFVGVTKVASVSEEVKNPEKNLPIGVFMALGTALIIYIVGTSVMVGILGTDALDGDYTPAATTAEVLFGSTGKLLMTISAILAFSSVANAGILSASRYPLAMSRDHLLPTAFRKLSAKGHPTMGVLLTVGIVLVFMVAFDPTKIAKLASAFQLLVFATLCIAVIVMRECKIDSYDPGFKSPWYPWMQIAGVVTPLWLIAGMGWLPILFTVLLIAGGTLWYYRYAHRLINRRGAIFHIFERLGRFRHTALDTELRSIMKEKGLRKHDPFDEIVARSQVLDMTDETSFSHLARDVARLLGERTGSNPEKILEGFMHGTQVGATPVSHGVALPHVRVPGIEHPELVLVRARIGIVIDIDSDFMSDQDRLSRSKAAYFIMSPEDDPGQHLRILAEIASIADNDAFMDDWLAAKGEQELKEVMLRDERYFSLKVSEGMKTAELVDKSLTEVPIPHNCLVAIIDRDGFTFVPRGSTTFKIGDRLTIIGDAAGIRDLKTEYGLT